MQPTPMRFSYTGYYFANSQGLMVNGPSSTTLTGYHTVVLPVYPIPYLSVFINPRESTAGYLMSRLVSTLVFLFL